MNTDELAEVLTRLGCPRDKSPAMAAQLDKRAHQLAREKNRPYEEALEHLLKLMAQGWAAPPAGRESKDESQESSRDI